jgi:small subunit ribosomal protein S27e
MDKKTPRSKFLLVKHDCGNEQYVFDNTKTEVNCLMCNKVLAKPTGGHSLVFGKILKVIER